MFRNIEKLNEIMEKEGSNKELPRVQFSELDTDQRTAIQITLNTALAEKIKQSNILLTSGLRFLIIGNGAAIVVLGAFLGGIYEGPLFNELIPSLVLFVIGACVSALSYIPLILVSAAGINHLSNEIFNFFLDKKRLNEITGYGFNKIGQIVFSSILLISLLAFMIGVANTIYVLFKFTRSMVYI